MESLIQVPDVSICPTSLLRLLEYLLRKAKSGNCLELEDLTIADWVNEVAEGRVGYIRKYFTCESNFWAAGDYAMGCPGEVPP